MNVFCVGETELVSSTGFDDLLSVVFVVVVVVSESVSGADSSELARQQQRHGDDQVTVASATSRLSLSLVVEQSSEEVEGTLVLSWVHLEHVWVGVVAEWIWLAFSWQVHPWSHGRTAVYVSVLEFVSVFGFVFLVEFTSSVQIEWILSNSGGSHSEPESGSSNHGHIFDVL